MSKRRPGAFARRESDYYPTPAEAVAPLLPYLRAGRFSEPCAGDGSLVRHLEACGMICTYAGDIATGQDAFLMPRFSDPIVSNPPYERKVMHALLAHFLEAAPSAWLLLEADWAMTKQARAFLPHCSDIVVIGRVRWIAGSASTGFDNYAWMRFAAEHRAGPILHPRDAPLRSAVCGSCGKAFLPARTDARFCGNACRQSAYRKRNASVTV